MDKIDWSNAPEWADRVVKIGVSTLLYWANNQQREMVKNRKLLYADDTHIRDNWEVVERRPTVNTGIDWSKAPHWADRVIEDGASNLLYWASDNTLQPVKGGTSFVTHTHIRNGLPVVERRPVPKTINIGAAFATTKPSPTFNCKCTVGYRTIEQRIASLRALEEQVEETRAELTRDLEALGLTWMVQDEPEQPTITDWRDLRVGDVIIIDYVDAEPTRKKALEGVESIIVRDNDEFPICATNENYPEGQSWFMGGTSEKKWRFIRRP